MEKQTAVEWLIEQLNKNTWYDESNCPQVNIGVINLEQAKEMEKQQIIDAVVWFDDTERTPSQIEIGAQIYYNETFKNTNK